MKRPTQVSSSLHRSGHHFVHLLALVSSQERLYVKFVGCQGLEKYQGLSSKSFLASKWGNICKCI